MKTFLVIIAIVATGLIVLDAFCQQGDKDDSIFNWQLKAPPSAAGYGDSPFEPVDTSKQERTSSPSADHQPPNKQPAAEKKVTEHNNATLTIEPPPSAAGYGSSPFESVDTSKEKTTSPSSPAVSEPADEQPAVKEENSSGQSWSIEPPPSDAAGYGNPFKK